MLIDRVPSWVLVPASFFVGGVIGVGLYTQSLYAEICEVDSGANEHCSRYNVALFFLIKVAEFLDTHDGVVTAIATIAIAWFTLSLRDVSREQGKISRTAVDLSRNTERAYVKMSHRAPGLEWGFWVKCDDCSVRIQVKNHGSTPADVTDVVVKCLVLRKSHKLPGTPNYRQRGARPALKAFLVKDDEFTYSTRFQLTTRKVAAVKKGNLILFIYGYADYIDRFGDRHRGGYARQYQPGLDILLDRMTAEERQKVNNLLFVTQRGYNYDRSRLPGEGNDWEKTKA